MLSARVRLGACALVALVVLGLGGAEGPRRARAQSEASALDGAPLDFALEATSGRVRRATEARGRVVALFYEARAHAATNREFKQLLHRFVVDNHLEGEVTTYAVAAIGLPEDGVVRRIARAAISAIAERYGLEILLDWDGALARAPLAMRLDAPNTALVDRAGRVRWRHAGAIGDEERRAFFRAMRVLLRERAE